MYYAQIVINRGALVLRVPCSSSRVGFRTLRAAARRLEGMDVTGYDKSKERAEVQARVIDNQRKVVWSIAL